MAATLSRAQKCMLIASMSLSACAPGAQINTSLAAQVGATNTKEPWHTGFPGNSSPANGKTELPRSLFFEIPLSQFSSAEQLLESKSIVKIENGYFGHFPQCPSGTIPYLTRAVWERTNGTFFVYLKQSEVFVLNAAFGPPETLNRSALVMCLDFTPTATYTEISGAM